MKKLILLGLVTIGVGVAGMPAQAGGLTVILNPFRLPLLLPPPPIFVPAVVFAGGCGPAVAIHGDRRAYYHYDRRARFDARRVDHRDYYRHDRF